MRELTKIPSETFYYKLEKEVGKDLLNKIKEYKGFIAGGACRSWFEKESASDYDFFFESSKQYLDFKDDIEAENNEGFMDDINHNFNNEYEKVWLSDNASTYRNLDTDVTIQFIHNHYNPIKEQVASFDFTVCAVAYDLSKKCFYTHPKFFDDLNEKRLRVIATESSMLYPLAELERVAKYSRKGYKTKAIDIVTLLLFIGQRFKEIETYDDFKREINGMDIQLIDGIFEKTNLKLEDEFDGGTLFEAIIELVDENIDIDNKDIPIKNTKEEIEKDFTDMFE